MTDAVCAVVLAAGLGTRLRPLTDLVPKALVPVGNIPLLERALMRLEQAGFAGPGQVAVNAHWLAEQVVAYADGRAQLSVELGRPLGTAGALGRLRTWIDGRAVLVLNADAYLATPPGDLADLLGGWDGRQVRLHGVRGDHPHTFHGYNFAGASLLPAADVAALADEPGELVGAVWRPAERMGRLSVVEVRGTFIDCGTPASYLAANLDAAARLAGPGANLLDAQVCVTGSASASVLGKGCTVAGSVRRCVLWPGAMVRENEVLADAIRVGDDLTVPAV